MVKPDFWTLIVRHGKWEIRKWEWRIQVTLSRLKEEIYDNMRRKRYKGEIASLF